MIQHLPRLFILVRLLFPHHARVQASAATCNISLPRELQYSVKTLFEFSDQTFIENIAVRRNGHVLITTFDRGRVYSIDPRSPSPQARLAAQLPDANAVTGIAEMAPDVFFAVGGNLDQGAMRYDPPSLRAFRLDFGGRGEGAATVDTIARMPKDLNLSMLNGVAVLPTSPARGVVLAADSVDGRIVRIDSNTGSVDVVSQDAMLGPPAGSMIPLGVNGIQVVPSLNPKEHGYLYFTNSARHLLGRMPIGPDGQQAGAAEDIASLGNFQFPDDLLAESSTGSSYIAVHPDSVVRVSSDGIQDVIAKGLLEPTSLASDPLTGKIYVVTGGSAARERMFGRSGGTGGQLLVIAPVREQVCHIEWVRNQKLGGKLTKANCGPVCID